MKPTATSGEFSPLIRRIAQVVTAELARVKGASGEAVTQMAVVASQLAEAHASGTRAVTFDNWQAAPPSGPPQ